MGWIERAFSGLRRITRVFGAHVEMKVRTLMLHDIVGGVDC